MSAGIQTSLKKINNLKGITHMNIEKQRRFIINFIFFVILFGISVFLVRYALPALFPFVTALLVTWLLRPIVNFCVCRLHTNRKLASALLVILFYGTIGLLVVLLTIKLVGAAGSLIAKLPDFFNQSVTPAIKEATASISGLIENFDADSTIDLNKTVSSIISTLSTAISDFSGKALAFVGSYATSVPAILVNIVITIVATAFMLMDYDHIKKFIAHQLPEERRVFISTVFEHLGHVIWKYITSYAIILTITFAELAIGLICIGQKNALGIAAAVAVFDILPVVGSGTVLVPWAVISMLTGGVGRGIGLLVVWVLISIVRQIIEPKIVGDTVGMHPLLTLFAMLFGNFVYGGLGILLVPIALALCQNLQEHGVIHLYKSIPANEAEDDDPGLWERLWGAVCRRGKGSKHRGESEKTDKEDKNKNSNESDKG